MKIVIDEREHEKWNIFEFLQHAGFDVEIHTLAAADYLFVPNDWIYGLPSSPRPHIVYTVKTGPDFLKSTREGHMMQEIFDIRMNYPFIPQQLLIVNEPKHYRNRSLQNFIRKHKKTINFVIPTETVKNRDFMIEHMVLFADKSIQGKLQNIDRQVRKKKVTDEDAQVAFYANSIPGVSFKIAQAIQKVYPQPIDFIDALMEGKIEKIPGISSKSSKLNNYGKLLCPDQWEDL